MKMLTDKFMRWGSYLLTIIGLIDSAYLTWVKISHTEVYCGTSGECQIVSNSPYSEIAGIPIALFGMGAYFVLLILIYLETRSEFWFINSPLFVFGITLAGTLYSAYLTYIEIAVLRAICPYCVLSAIVMLLLFAIAIIRLFRVSPEAETIRNLGG
jgi:uncharacterized membrane protein